MSLSWRILFFATLASHGWQHLLRMLLFSRSDPMNFFVVVVEKCIVFVIERESELVIV